MSTPISLPVIRYASHPMGVACPPSTSAMSGEVGYANGCVDEGEAKPFSHCLEHGPRRPFLGFRVDHVCNA